MLCSILWKMSIIHVCFVYRMLGNTVFVNDDDDVAVYFDLKIELKWINSDRHKHNVGGNGTYSWWDREKKWFSCGPYTQRHVYM